ncbi:MAG: hypothetical protein JJE52_01440 [Acidimicrobiia bacterium]|nr:hypothetical protein [Acidimicrobiia bacterium]
MRSSTARLATAALLAGTVLTGCTTTPADIGSPATTGAESLAPTTGPTAPTSSGPTSTTPPKHRCPAGALDPAFGQMSDSTLDEISGAAASPTADDIVWVHEDSGNPAVLTAVTLDGSVVSRWTIDGVEPVDWEDMASATSPGGHPTLFVGDIGDNRAVRDHVNVLRIPEPDPRRGDGIVAPLRTLRLTLPQPADVEALLIDPLHGDLVLVTKSLIGESDILVAPGGAWAAGSTPLALEHAGTLRLGLLSAVLAGDVAADGSTIVLRTPGNLWQWSRDGETSLVDTMLGQEPCRLPSLVDPYGEAVATLADGTQWLVGEGVEPTIAAVN